MHAVADQIRREIHENGPMTLARFMELALYLPSDGYYETQQEIGQRGDFYTSVSVGPVFGELLAFQFAAWLERFPRCSIVEAGAHNGRLASDILGWMRRSRPEVFARVEYVLIEPSVVHRQWQERTLAEFSSRLRWVGSVEELPPASVHGVILSNELLDAVPMHRLGWDAAQEAWHEWRVIADGESFSWIVGELSSECKGHLPEVPPELARVLPDRFTVEISPWAKTWWRRATESLGAGKILTIDYGLTADEWLRPQNAGGTLRSYAAHRLADDPLANPGRQDLTAHIDFSALQKVGEAAGLVTEGLVTQSSFLTRIFAQTQAEAGTFDEWTPGRARQFQTLTHPEHLGRPFRVLTQARPTGTSGRPPTC